MKRQIIEWIENDPSEFISECFDIMIYLLLYLLVGLFIMLVCAVTVVYPVATLGLAGMPIPLGLLCITLAIAYKAKQNIKQKHINNAKHQEQQLQQLQNPPKGGSGVPKSH